MTNCTDGPPHLSAEDLRWFCQFLYTRTGIQLGESKRYYIERRLFARLAATGSASFPHYFILLRSEPEEVVRVVDAFTVNETYFYREDYQFRCLSQDLLPEIVQRKAPGDRVRIWSQPCSTGEEAYSIAIWLLENWRMVDAYNVEIVGSDIDATALAAARAGRYGDAHWPAVRKRWLRRISSRREDGVADDHRRFAGVGRRSRRRIWSIDRQWRRRACSR